MEWLRADPDRVVLVATEFEVSGITYFYPDLRDRVCSLGRWGEFRRGRRPFALGIDNADFVLSKLLGHPIHRMTMTKGPGGQPG